MADVIDLKGRAAPHGVEKPGIEALRLLLANHDAGHEISAFYLIVELDEPGAPGRIVRQHADSGMTVSEAVYRLEMEKFTLLQMMTSA